MRRFALLLLCLLASATPSWAQLTSHTAQRFVTYPSDPTVCTVGDVEYNSVGVVYKYCTATNTWGLTIGVGGITLPSAAVISWNSDTGISRDAAGVVDIGTGAQGSIAGSVVAAAYNTVIQADAKCAVKGTLNDVCITNAIAAAPVAGATIHLRAGTWTFTAPVVLQSNLTFQCDGPTSTLLTGDPGNAGLFQTPLTSVVSGIQFFNCGMANTHTNSGAEASYAVIQARSASKIDIIGNNFTSGRAAVQGTLTTRDVKFIGNSCYGMSDLCVNTNTPQHTVTTASGTGTTATVTCQNVCNGKVGDKITVTGMNPSTYNITNAAVTAVSSNTVSYLSTANGAFVSGGLVAINNTEWVIANNLIDGTNDTGVLGPPHDIGLEDTNNSIVQGNVIIDRGGFVTANSSAIQSFNNHSGQVSNVNIVGNVLKQMPIAPTGVNNCMATDSFTSTTLAGSSYIGTLVQNNSCDGYNVGLSITSNAGTPGFIVTGAKYDGNSITNGGKGLVVQAPTDTIYNVDVSVSNNICSLSSSGPASSHCYDFDNVQGLMITNNKGTGSLGEGMQFASSSFNTAIGNTLYNNATGSSTKAEILITSSSGAQNSVGNLLIAPVAYDTLSSATVTPAAGKAVQLAAAAVNTKLIGYTAFGENTRNAAINDSGSGTMILDPNLFKGFGVYTYNTVATPAVPTVSPTCTGTCLSTWGYKAVARAGTGNTVGSAEQTTTLQAATLDTTHFNTLTCPATPGADEIYIYRTTVATSPATTGFIGSCSAGGSLVDNGIAGDASTVPAANTTGQVNFTPGFYLAQGTGMPAGTTDILIQAPTSVTSYRLTLPGTAPTGATNGVMGFTNAAPSVGSFMYLPSAVLTANTAGITATTPGTTAITLGALPTSKNVLIDCEGTYQQNTAAAAGTGFAVQGATNAPTRLDAWGVMNVANPASAAPTQSQGSLANLATTTATSVVTGTPGASGTTYQFSVKAMVQVGASASTFNLLAFTGNASDAIVVNAGSYCMGMTQ